jgi:hypothetical protein
MANASEHVAQQEAVARPANSPANGIAARTIV